MIEFSEWVNGSLEKGKKPRNWYFIVLVTKLPLVTSLKRAPFHLPRKAIDACHT